MAATCSISMVGDKLIVGAIDTSFLSASSKVTPGTSVLNGPVYIGAAIAAGVARATCMIGPPLSIGLPASLEVQGISIFDGIVKVLGTHTLDGTGKIFGSQTIDGFATTLGTSDVDGYFNVSGETVLNGDVDINGELVVAGTVEAAEVFNAYTNLGEVYAVAQSKKGFDIPHPTKQDHRLRYICIEGPSAEVYLRGKLKNNNIIKLPEYWRNLIDSETIGVSLTPIGQYQELFVEKIEKESYIKIKNNLYSPIHCDYVVFAERKDTSKNIPEYKGLTPADYPGDNSEYVINGKKYE